MVEQIFHGGVIVFITQCKQIHYHEIIDLVTMEISCSLLFFSLLGILSIRILSNLNRSVTSIFRQSFGLIQ